MPVFTYNCPKCDNTFDELVRNESEEPVCCPVCCCTEIEKVCSTVSIAFKGRGFYVNDN